MGSVGEPRRPNFLIIVADDLGYSDIGPFGSEIPTPALDKLAHDGIRLTNFHTASACSPTRAMLFSGTDNHIAGLGQMAEYMNAYKDRYQDRPGYEGYLNFKVAALSEVLQDAGYHTIMSGKWHLGLSENISPYARGFDDSFAFLTGCGNHFNYEPQLENPSDAIFAPMNAAKFWMRDDKFLDRIKDLPSDFHSTVTFTDQLIEYLSSRGESDKAAAPFFAYLPFTAPHWPLQAPKELIEQFKGKYADGPDSLRAQRLQRMIEMGLIKPTVDPAEPVRPPTPWSALNETEKAESSRKMEVFAAMVAQIDVSLEKLFDHLASTGELDNTFILFMSDNGAEGAMLEALPIMGGSKSVTQIIDKYYNNDMDNMGAADSYIWYGPEWACASMAPSRGYKCWITEGGIRCPCIVRYPPLQNQGLRSGSTSDSFCTVMDIMPTILDLAGVKHPHPKPFRGREIVPMRGSSWLPHLRDQQSRFHTEEQHITGWELFGLRAIRRGNYKALYMNAPRGKDAWELYDLDSDPGEIHDLAEKEPGILEELIRHWEVYYAETGMFDPGHAFSAA